MFTTEAVETISYAHRCNDKGFSQKPCTLLLLNTSWWPTSSYMAIAFRAAGMKVAAVYPAHGHPLAKTDAVADHHVYSPTSPLNSVCKAIQRSGAEWIVPCDDRALEHLHLLHKLLVASDKRHSVAQLIERSLGDPAGYAVIGSRALLLAAAKDEGISIPSTYVIDTLETLANVAAQQSFPLVMKVDGSWGGLGVSIVHTMEQACATYARMTSPVGLLPALKRAIVNRDAFSIESWRKPSPVGVIVQSFIQGRPANCVAFCKDGQVLASIAVEVVAAQSAAGPATKVRIVKGTAMRRAAKALARRLCLSGFYGFDFMLQEKSGDPHLVEMNPRCALPCHLAVQPGGDLVAALASELLGTPIERKAHLGMRDVISYFPQAWLADPADHALKSDYHDVPWSEPRLVKELLLLPWPDRSLLARLSARLRGTSYEQRAVRVVDFDDPVPAQEPAWLLSPGLVSEPK